MSKKILTTPLTPPQWGLYLGRSRGYFHHLQRVGMAPDTVLIGHGTQRKHRLITPKAHADWLARLDALAASQSEA